MASAGPGEGNPRKALQDARRGLLGPQERLALDDKGLLKRILAGKHRMADHVGEHQPARPRREFHPGLWAGLLEPMVFFRELVEAKHHGVIGRTDGRRTASPTRDAGECLPEWRRVLARHLQQPSLPGKALDQRFERLRSDPDPSLLGVNVRETAHDPAAICRAGGEGIDAQQVVARVLRIPIKCAIYSDRKPATHSD